MGKQHYPLTWHFRAKPVLIALLVAAFLFTGAAPRLVSAGSPEAGPPAPHLAAPPPPAGLTAVELTGKQLLLRWQRSAGAARYRLYRSTVQGAYSPAGLIYTYVVTNPYDQPQYTDSSFDPGLRTYYYVVTAVNAQGEESVYSNEASGLPHYKIDWAGMVWAFPGGDPCEACGMTSVFDYTLGDPSARPVIAGEIFIWHRTGEVYGPEPDVWAQFGYGPVEGDPATEQVDLTGWTTWQDAYYYSPGKWNSANSRYLINFSPEQPGQYYFAYRFSTNAGRSWVYGDRVETVTTPASAAASRLGRMTIYNNPSDSEPPAAPVLSVADFTETTVSLDWTESPSPDIYAYDLYRSQNPSELGQRVSGGRLLAGGPTEFTDTGLVAGTQYYYRVIALDTSFNAAQSNQVSVETQHSPVTFTLNVTIPAVTPGTVYINREYDQDAHLFGAENWTGIPLDCNFALRVCTVELTIQENAALNFRFSRGSPQTIQTQFDGNSPAIDPSFTVERGLTAVNRIVANWDDPLVTAFTPQGAGVSPYTSVSVTWNQAMPAGTVFSLQDMGSDGLGPAVNVTGDFSFDPAATTLTLTPDALLKGRWHYAVEAAGQTDLNGIPQQAAASWTFITGDFIFYLPRISR